MDFAKDETSISKILNALAEQISNHPSVIDPQLLKKAESLCSTDILSDEVKEKLDEPLNRIKKAFENYQQLRDLAETYLEKTGTNKYWIQSRQRTFFCLSQLRIPAFMRGEKISYANFEGISVRFLPKEEIRRAFEKVILDKRISLPNYFSVTVEMEGEPLAVKVNSSTNFSASVLAESTEEMTLFPKMFTPRVVTRQSGAHNIVALNFEGNASAKFTRFLFEQAEFTVRIHLADRHLLLAQPRYRSILFGALIAFSVVVALVGFVSARRAFYRQLRLNELKSNFVSSVSHELRAPIASVRLLAESLERGKIAEPRKQNEYFKFIVQECRRLSSLIENVLDFSRIEQGRKEYEFEPTDIVKLVRETAKLMEPYAAEKNVNLVLELNDARLSPENSQPILDGHAIQQALVNLIDNAIKHSPADSSVIVGLNLAVNRSAAFQRAGSEASCLDDAGSVVTCTQDACATGIQLYVEDSGPGIPSQEHEKIFERFYRLGSELRRETQGAGIGLSIVKHIVEAHGG
jgi:signal transduction histidine kinase